MFEGEVHLKRLLAIALLVFFSACMSRIPRDPGILVRDLHSEPSHFNPYTATDAYSGMVSGYIYESLLQVDNQTLKPKAWIAKSWEISPDGLSYTFFLRDDVRWSDGVKFTADDVVYSFNTLMDKKVDAAAHRSYLQDVKHVEKVGDNAVRFLFARPYFRALEQVGYLTIIPKHIFDNGMEFNTHPANRRPVGTGPYVLAKWDAGKSILLERNPLYWGKVPQIKGVQFLFISDVNTAFQFLKKGGMDISTDLRAVQWIRQSESPKFKERFEKYKFFPPGLAYIGWNEAKPYFKDKQVRQALTMMLNRQKIADRIAYGQVKIVSGPSYPFGPGYDPSIEPYPFDPVRAKKLLDAAGWVDHDGDGIRDKEGIPFRFIMMYGSGSPTGDRVGSIFREELKNIGIDMEPRPMEFSALLKVLMSGEFDAMMLAWAGGLTESDNYQIFHSSQIDGGSNRINFSNPEADKLMEAVRVTLDPEKRKKLQYELHALMHDQEPYTFLYIPASLGAVDRRFTNVIAYPMGFDPTEWGYRPELRYME